MQINASKRQEVFNKMTKYEQHRFQESWQQYWQDPDTGEDYHTDLLPPLRSYARFTDARKPGKIAGVGLSKLLLKVYASECPDPQIMPHDISVCYYSEYYDVKGLSYDQNRKLEKHYDDVYHYRKGNKKWSRGLINRMVKETSDVPSDTR